MPPYNTGRQCLAQRATPRLERATPLKQHRHLLCPRLGFYGRKHRRPEVATSDFPPCPQMSVAGFTPGLENQSGLSDLPATLAFMEYQQVTELVASMRLDPYCSLTPRFLVVVDANAILSSVDNDCRKGPGRRAGRRQGPPGPPRRRPLHRGMARQMAGRTPRPALLRYLAIQAAKP